MKGSKVLRKIGLDTHGLPIEVNVEKKLGFKSKADIENFGIENFDKKREIQLSEEEDDLIDVYVTCEIYTEYKGSFQAFNEPPEPDEIESRSVTKLSIDLFNKQGEKVKINVLGEYHFNEIFKRRQDCSPIDIEEEVIKYFEI